MNKKSLLLCILLVCLSGSTAIAQPLAIVQFFGGYSMPLGDFHGAFGDSTLLPLGSPDTNNYLLKSGLNYGITIKKPITKSGQFIITGSLLFNSFSQEKDYAHENVQLRYGVLSVSLGAEWQYSTRKTKVNPFVGFDVNFNLFSGSLVSTSITTTTTYNLKHTTRLGVSAGGGIDFAFHQNVGIVVGAKYTMANLIGRTSSPQGTGQIFFLNDAAYTQDGSSYAARDIHFIQFYGGMSFYFGK